MDNFFDLPWAHNVMDRTPAQVEQALNEERTRCRVDHNGITAGNPVIPDTITIGKLSDSRRVRILRRCEFDIFTGQGLERYEGLKLSKCGTRFELTLPTGILIYINSRTGDFNSYVDSEGICQDITQQLAEQCDDYIVEISGITSNMQVLN